MALEDQVTQRAETRLSFFLQQQVVQKAKLAFLRFMALLKNASLYPPAHPFLLGSAEQLLVSLEELFSDRNEASFHFVSGELFFGTLSVQIEEVFSQGIEEFVQRDIGGFTYRKGLERQEVIALAYLLQKAPGAASGDLREQIQGAGITHVTVLPVPPRRDRKNRAGDGTERSARELYQDGIETVKDLIQSAQHGKMPNTRQVQMLVQGMADSIMGNRDALLGLTTLKLYDEYTFAHSVNVSILSLAMGTYLSFDRPQVASLGVAGLLHDIGKVNVPVEIINKPDGLADAEWDIVKRHPVEGARILSGMPGITRLAMVAAFDHHRQYDLKGYPHQSPGAQPLPHPYSRIVAIADAYDAITSARVYFRMITPPYEAVRLLLTKRGTIFDPVLVKAFVNMVGIFPIGTLLRLTTGEIALVVRQTRDLLRPSVLLLTTFDGTETEEVSLLETRSGAYGRSAVATIAPQDANIDLVRYFQ
jgi:HD-GYP domain-containing protein (c-di-GMP phosphodiesterase class II)